MEDLWVKVEGREEERNVLERRGKVWKKEKRNKKKEIFFSLIRGEGRGWALKFYFYILKLFLPANSNMGFSILHPKFDAPILEKLPTKTKRLLLTYLKNAKIPI